MSKFKWGFYWLLVGLFLFILQTNQAVAASLPDLRILSVGFSHNTNNELIGNVIITKMGWSSVTQSFNILSEWLDRDGNVINSCSSGASNLYLGIVATAVARSCPANLAEKAYKLRVTVDSDTETAGINKVAESNENNNVWEGNIPLPDLAFQGDIIFTAQNTVIAPIFTVKNIGNGIMTKDFSYTVDWRDGDNNSLFVCNPNYESAFGNNPWKFLDPNKTKEIDTHYCFNHGLEINIPKVDKAVKAIITLDHMADTRDFRENQVFESNENNNVKEVVYPLPDLKVEGMNFRGTDKHPEVTFINKGTAAANETTRVVYDWYGINGERLGGCYENISALGRNKRYTQKNVFCGNNASYEYATKFKATIDVGGGTSEAPDSQVYESDENNNSLDWPIPGRVEFVRLHPPEIINTEPALPSVTVPDEVIAPPNIAIPKTPVVEVPVISDNNTVTVPTPKVDAPVLTPPTPVVPTIPETPPTPVVEVPVISDDYTITVPTPVVETPAPTTPAPAPVVDAGDKYPSITANISDDGLATYTVEGALNYYGTKAGCTGPRYFDPIIVAWGQVNTHPVLDSNNHYVTSHKYDLKNSEYTVSVSFINSCFQRTTKSFIVHPKL